MKCYLPHHKEHYGDRDNMDIYLNDYQREIRQNIVDYIINNLNPSIIPEKFTMKAWEACAKGGLLAYNLSNQYGDMEFDITAQMVITEAMGYACKDSGLVFAVNNHLWACQAVIQKFGSTEAKNKYLKDMGQGKKIGAYAITEEGAGSDNSNMKTTFQIHENHYVLNGRKAFISNAPIADIFVVIAKNKEKQGISSYSAFIVEKDLAGVIVKDAIAKMGLNGCPMSEIVFEDCIIPKENILGRVNSGIRIINYAMTVERFFEFVSHIGTMRKILDKCIEYTGIREQFNNTLDKYQMITSKIVQSRVNIELAYSMAINICKAMEVGKNVYMQISMFKLFVSEKYVELCKDAMQIHGAYGYICENEIERELRDSLASTIYAGTNEVQTNIIFRLLKHETNE